MAEVPVTFTPDNEPFLRRESVYRLDLVISRALEGHPNATPFNLIDLGDGAWGHAVGKNLSDEGLCDFVCDQAMCWLIVLAGRRAGCFPDVLPPPLAKAESGEAS